jgi:hypothetical protein
MIYVFPINPISLSMKHMGLKAGCPYKNNQLHQRDVSRYFTIADAKRGGEYLDVCKAFFDLNFDSVTVAPYGKRFSGALPCL